MQESQTDAEGAQAVMPYGLNPGLGLTQCETPFAAFSGECWTRAWDGLFGPAGPVVAPPRAPTGEVLTVPPASGVDAQATVDALVNQQLRDQQALNARGIKASFWDEASSEVIDDSNSVKSSAFPWLLLAAGLGVFALVAISGGSARRYGR